jgi:hypothetical protein
MVNGKFCISEFASRFLQKQAPGRTARGLTATSFTLVAFLLTIKDERFLGVKVSLDGKVV